MKIARWVLATVGLAVLGLGAAVVVLPDGATLVPVEPLVETAGNDYFVLAAFGVVMVAATLFALGIRAVAGLDQTTPPDPEEVRSAPRPGSTFDERVRGTPPVRALVFGDRRDELRERLRDRAVTLEMRRDGLSRSEARRRVERGEWTDDREAAAFLAADGRGPGPGASARVRAALRGEPWFQRGARRTARVISGSHEEANA